MDILPFAVMYDAAMNDFVWDFVSPVSKYMRMLNVQK